MSLTKYMIDLGRVVAYHPNLKKVTGSTTATILLSQFIYWTNKAKGDDGWIWKTSEQIEEETGLTYHEQKTARDRLVELGILEEEFKRLRHTSRYRVDQDVLNTTWEHVTGMKSPAVIKKENKKEIIETDISVQPYTSGSPVSLGKLDNGQIDIDVAKSEPVKKTDIKKKGDIIDGMIAFNSSPGAIKMRKMQEIRDEIEKKLTINLGNPKWEKFIDFVYSKQEVDGEPLSKFIEWALDNGFHPIYWSADKMQTVWPQAFVEKMPGKPREDFYEKLPPMAPDDSIPMPKHLARKKDLY